MIGIWGVVNKSNEMIHWLPEKFGQRFPPFPLIGSGFVVSSLTLNQKLPCGPDGSSLSFLCQQRITTVSTQELSEPQNRVVCSVESEVLQCHFIDIRGLQKGADLCLFHLHTAQCVVACALGKRGHSTSFR